MLPLIRFYFVYWVLTAPIESELPMCQKAPLTQEMAKKVSGSFFIKKFYKYIQRHINVHLLLYVLKKV